MAVDDIVRLRMKMDRDNDIGAAGSLGSKFAEEASEVGRMDEGSSKPHRRSWSSRLGEGKKEESKANIDLKCSRRRETIDWDN